jgi:hypothetical protein
MWPLIKPKLSNVTIFIEYLHLNTFFIATKTTCHLHHPHPYPRADRRLFLAEHRPHHPHPHRAAVAAAATFPRPKLPAAPTCFRPSKEVCDAHFVTASNAACSSGSTGRDLRCAA